jgi:hypothetical protein
MSGIIGSKLNHRGSGLVGSVGTDGQVMTSSGAGKSNVFETASGGVTAAEATAIRQDVTTLALKQAVNENKAAFNLPNTFIDQFEDDTGIGSEVDCNRGDELVSTAVTTVNAAKEDTTGLTASSLQYYDGGYTAAKAFDDSYTTYWADNGTETVPQYLSIDFGSGNTEQILRYKLHGYNLDGSMMDSWEFKGSNTSADVRTGGTVLDTVTLYDWTNSGPSGVGGDGIYDSGTLVNATGYRYYGVHITTIVSGTAHIYMGEFELYAGSSTFNATGTLTGIANIPSSAQTKISGVMLYKDNEGTATIGTDLKIEFTCDGGSNWTEAASYTAVTPVFSTGIKMIKLGETTCTSGSDVRYRAVWANQSTGSKETQLHGIGINY